MKNFIFILGLLLFLCSCKHYKKCGSSMPLNVVLKGFSETELDSLTLFSYTKNNLFNDLIDSTYLNYQMSNKNYFQIRKLDFDYKVSIADKNVFISNLKPFEVYYEKRGLVVTKEMMACPLNTSFIVQGNNATQHDDTLFIQK